MTEEWGLELGSDEYINDKLIWGDDRDDDGVVCDDCKGTKDCTCCEDCGFATCQCVRCENCDNVTDEEPNDDGRIFCWKCAEGCGTCGFDDCQCDAMYDAWRERYFD